MCHPSWQRARAEAHHLGALTRLRRARDRIDREYARPLDVAALAAGVRLSAADLGRQFRLAYGEQPQDYLMTRRVERAVALLRGGALGAAEVCSAVGCSSPHAFAARFTELVGISPEAYRSSVAAAGSGTGVPEGETPGRPGPASGRGADEAPLA